MDKLERFLEAEGFRREHRAPRKLYTRIAKALIQFAVILVIAYIFAYFAVKAL